MKTYLGAAVLSVLCAGLTVYVMRRPAPVTVAAAEMADPADEPSPQLPPMPPRALPPRPPLPIPPPPADAVAPVPHYATPQVEGLPLDQAESQLEGVEYDVRDGDCGEESGEVCSTYPFAGQPVAGTVIIWVQVPVQVYGSADERAQRRDEWRRLQAERARDAAAQQRGGGLAREQAREQAQADAQRRDELMRAQAQARAEEEQQRAQQERQAQVDRAEQLRAQEQGRAEEHAEDQARAEERVRAQQLQRQEQAQAEAEQQARLRALEQHARAEPAPRPPVERPEPVAEPRHYEAPRAVQPPPAAVATEEAPKAAGRAHVQSSAEPVHH